MLIIDAEIQFDTDKNKPSALAKDLDTKNVIRPAINFGNGMLFSGDIIPIENVQMLIRGQNYNVSIDMLTIEDEAYEAIQNLVKVGNKFLIQNASRVIGRGTIKEFVFE